MDAELLEREEQLAAWSLDAWQLDEAELRILLARDPNQPLCRSLASRGAVTG